MSRLIRRQIALLGLWLAGCAYAPARTASDPRASHEEPPLTQSADRGLPKSEALDEVEQHIAAVMERAMLSAPDQSRRSRANGVVTTQRKRLPSSDFHQAVNARPERELAVVNRSETLQVVDSSGGECAAVSIASRLAVTALHCVRTLCESSPRANTDHPTPVGCQVPYRLPRGTHSTATVVAISESDLIALLDLKVPHQRYGALYCDDPRARDPVYTVTHAGDQAWDLTYGRLTREPIELHWAGGSYTRVLVAEISTKLGSSGGGLFDVEDNLVGIQIARWSPWSDDFGKAAFIQASRIFSLAGQYCMQDGASACVGLRCVSTKYDIWNFNQI